MAEAKQTATTGLAVEGKIVTREETCESCGVSRPVPVTPHGIEHAGYCCEVVLTAGHSKCKKHPGHTCFHRVKDLTVDKLPSEMRHPSVMDFLKAVSQLVVRLSVGVTSAHRDPTDPWFPYVGRGLRRSGTGTVFDIIVNTSDTNVSLTTVCYHHPQPHTDTDDPHRFCSLCRDCDLCHLEDCPLTETEGDPHRGHSAVFISTAHHVVHDHTEAMATEVDFFYDDVRDHSNVVNITTGMGWYGGDKGWDMSHIVYVTRDRQPGDVIDRLVSARREAMTAYDKIPSDVIQAMWEDDKHRVCISHPHGMEKRLSMGEMKEKEKVYTPDGEFSHTRFTYTTPTCPGSSGAPVWRGESWWLFPFHHLIHSGTDINTGLNESNCGWFSPLPDRRAPL